MRRTLPLAFLLALTACAEEPSGEPGQVEQSVEVTTTYSASTGFSGIQGQGGWFYLSSATAYMTYNSSTAQWLGPQSYQWVYAAGAHPGTTGDAIRKWVAPRPGRARITGTASDAHTTCGNGVVVSIHAESLSNPALWTRTIPNAGAAQSFDLTVDVVTSTELFFRVGANGDNGCDSTNFAPTIALTHDDGTVGGAYASLADYVTPSGNHLQGYRGWTYEGTSGTPLQWVNGQWRRGSWKNSDPYQIFYISGANTASAHPGTSDGVVRKWTSPVAGTAVITGTLSDEARTCGNGVIGSITRTTRQGTETIWSKTIPAVQNFATPIDVVTPVAQGTQLKFVLVANGSDNGCDSTTFNPTITVSTSADGRVFTSEVNTPMAYDANDDYELPMMILPGGGSRQLQRTMAKTTMCWTSQNPLAEFFWTAGCIDSIVPDAGKPWKRNWYGAYSQVIHGGRVISFNGGENKNECGSCGSGIGQNTVDPTVTCSTPRWDGQACNGCNGDCGQHGFVSMSWQYWDSAHNWGANAHNDTGPIVWPPSGYPPGGLFESLGGPRVLMASGYFYLFYNYNYGNPATDGYLLARATQASLGMPGSWQTWCGTSGTWVNSLPAGFTKENMAAYYQTPGGCATRLAGLPTSPMSIGVAASTAGGYLAVIERFRPLSNGKQSWVIELYSSSNLTSWTYVTTLRERFDVNPDVQSNSWGAGDSHYPIFLSADGWRTDLVNPTSFFIHGTWGTADGTVTAYKLATLNVSQNGKSGSFGYHTANTSNATQNYKDATVALRIGETITVGTCAAPGVTGGDTYLRLRAPDGVEVAASDDACGNGSQIVHTAQRNGNYTVRMGCYSTGDCSGTVVYSIP
jgi:hypothetical protein